MLLLRARNRKQVGHLDPECSCNALQNIDCRVGNGAFDPADIGPIDIGLGCENLGRDASKDPKPPNVPRHKIAGFHARRAPICDLCSHGLYSYDL
jgi:hypothetical protein